tara:strand:+ start:1416 stop:2339 length:924 start_codon:yes stop_codon:yes gene_type:complete
MMLLTVGQLNSQATTQVNKLTNRRRITSRLEDKGYMTQLKIRTFLRTTYPLFLCFISLLTSAEDKLVFATHTKPPLSLYFKEVIQKALSPYSIEIEVIEMPGSRVISLVNSGQVDGDLCRVLNFKNVSDSNTSNYLLVNEPIALTEIVMITLAHIAAPHPMNWDTINQGKVAFLRGSKTIRKQLNSESRVAVSSSKQVLEMVANKRVDSAVMFASVAKNLLKQYPELKDNLVIQRPAVMSFQLFTYLNKKHAQLLPKLEFSLKQLKKNGFLAHAANKYQIIPANTLTQSTLGQLPEISSDKVIQLNK